MWTWPAQHNEWDAVLIVLAFFHEHLGDTSLFISFNADTKTGRPRWGPSRQSHPKQACREIDSQWTEVEKSLHIAHFSLPFAWTLYGMSMNRHREAWSMGSQKVRQDLVTEQQMDNVNIVRILYGIYILTSGFFLLARSVWLVKFLQSITPMIKIKVRSNIS